MIIRFIWMREFPKYLKVEAQLPDGVHGVDILVFLQPGHVLGVDDDVDDFDDLRGLDADTGEADPALVAGVVLHTEDNERDQQQYVDDDQGAPLLAEQIRVQHGEHNKGADPQKHGEQLHEDKLGRVHFRAGGDHAGGRLIDHRRPEEGADDAYAEQEHVRPVKEHAEIRSELLANRETHLSGREKTSIIVWSTF